MKINIYIIEKRSKDRIYSPLIEHYIKISKGFAKIEISYIFSRRYRGAHDISWQRRSSILGIITEKASLLKF